MPKGSYLTQFPLIIPSCRLWLDANDPSNNGTQFANGTAISNWVDKSGNQYNATQATGANQPIFQTGILANKPIMRFNGTTQSLSVSSTSFLSKFTNQITVFVVMSAAVIAKGFVFQGIPNSSLNRVAVSIPWDDSSVYWDFGNISGSGRLNGPWTGNINIFYGWTLQAGNSSMNVYKNGANILTKASASSVILSTTALSIGNNATGDPLFQGDIAELIFYNRALSAAEMLSINRYLANKWALPY